MKSKNRSQFGNAVRAVRNRRALTQEKLALQSGLHRTYISDIERGMRNPSLDSMTALCNPLGITLTGLMAEAML